MVNGSDSPQPKRVAQQERLHVDDVTFSDRAVPSMADGQVSGESRNSFAGENRFHQPQVLNSVKSISVVGENSGRVLAASRNACTL